MEADFLFRVFLYQMNHKRLLFLVSLVISDFSNHKTGKKRREAESTYERTFETKIERSEFPIRTSCSSLFFFSVIKNYD